MNLNLELDAVPGVFYTLGSGFFLPLKELVFQTQVTIGKKLSISCMFDIYIVLNNEVQVGFYFTTVFSVTNGGSYLLTKLANKGQATAIDVLIKTEDLVVYNYPNKGTLAISPIVSQQINTIFVEQ